MRVLLLTSAALLVFLVQATAQIGNPAGKDPATRERAPGLPAPGQTNVPDRLFVRLIAVGGLAEVDAAKLATQRAQNVSVKEFAERMADDHGKANARLSNLAKQANISLPAEPDPDQKAMRERLERADRAQFDLLYMQGQLVDHQKTVQLLQWEIGSGENADIQHFAAEMLPTVFGHLQMTQDILSRLFGRVPQGAAPAVAIGSAQ
jgi:Predicted outer membrane protein